MRTKPVRARFQRSVDGETDRDRANDVVSVGCVAHSQEEPEGRDGDYIQHQSSLVCIGLNRPPRPHCGNPAHQSANVGAPSTRGPEGSMKPDPRPRIYQTKVSGRLDSSIRSAPVSTLWWRKYHCAMAASFRAWFNRPSDTVRPTTRSAKANRVDIVSGRLS
jgi:hypothetical protein